MSIPDFLDEVERRYDRPVFTHEDGINRHVPLAQYHEDVHRLIVELRASRKVVEAARKLSASSREFACDHSFGPPDTLRLAWMIYDEAIAELSSINVKGDSE